MSGPWIKANWKWSNRRWQEWTFYGQHFRDQRTKMDWTGWIYLIWPLYIYYCGQESLRRNEVAITVKKRVRNAVLGCNLKNDRMISVCFQGKPFNITVIQVYALVTNTREAEVEWFYEDLQDLLELTPKKDVLFITEDWNEKVGSQETPGVWIQLSHPLSLSFSSCLQSFSASGSFPVSQFFDQVAIVLDQHQSFKWIFRTDFL